MKALLAAALVLGLVQPDAPSRVLFVGNSLTFANDLPGMVSALARAAGHRLECETVAHPDFSLEDHWRQGDARQAIARGGWDVVVLQQGPSALRESRLLLVNYTRRFDAEIRKAGATTALYMVWPAASRRGDAAAVSGSYTAAANAVRGTLLPAGDAFREAWRQDARLPLLGPDGFHPTTAGTYLAALVIYERLSGHPPPTTAPPGVSPAQAAVLQAAARTANAR